MSSPVLQFKRGSSSNVGLASFKAGEPGFTTDKYDFYIGLDATAANQKFFGSARYWSREDGSNSAKLKLVDKAGSNSLSLKAPDTLSGIGTYVFPDTTDGSTGDFLKLTSYTGNVYTLEWAAVPSGSFTIAADSGSSDTFTTGETLTFEGGEGIDTTVSNNKINITAEAASSTNAGISSFRDEFYFTDTYKVGIVTATTSIKGIASFNSNWFDVTAGDVSIKNGVTGVVTSISGTANEIEVSRSNGTVTVGLPDTVNITTLLDVPTVEASNIKAKDGTSAITITDATGAVSIAQNLTVSGNLYVNGSTTQVNTTSTTIEDQLLELGMVDGSAPSSDLDKDIGVLLNYYSGSAKKAAMFWDDSASRIVFADEVTESSGVLTVTSNAYAAIEIESLWINDCAGSSQVISCSGSTRTLENITVDGGSF